MMLRLKILDIAALILVANSMSLVVRSEAQGVKPDVLPIKTSIGGEALSDESQRGLKSIQAQLVDRFAPDASRNEEHRKSDGYFDEVIKNAQRHHSKLVNIDEAVSSSMKRFDEVTQWRSLLLKAPALAYSASCYPGAETGFRGYTASCLLTYSLAHTSIWLIRIHHQKVDYFPKCLGGTLELPCPTKRQSDSETSQPRFNWACKSSNQEYKDCALEFAHLHMGLNLIRAALNDYPLVRPAHPLYLLYNSMDEPQLFVEDFVVRRNVSLSAPYPGLTPAQLERILGKKREYFRSRVHPVATHSGFIFDRDGDSFESMNVYMGRLASFDIRSTSGRKRWSREHPPPPVFSWSTLPIDNFDIIAPNRHFGSCPSIFSDPDISKTAWRDKTRTLSFADRAVCEGGESDLHNERLRFKCMVARHEVQINMLGVTLDLGTAFQSPADQASSRYIVLLDGVVAAFRSTWYLNTRCIIFAAGFYFDVRTSLLKPWVHYIPLDLNFRDLEGKLGYLERHPEYAALVSENAWAAGRQLSGHDMGHSFDKRYWASLLEHYRASYSGTDAFEDDLSHERRRMFTNETFCSLLNSSGFQNSGCLGLSYACRHQIQDSVRTGEL